MKSIFLNKQKFQFAFVLLVAIFSVQTVAVGQVGNYCFEAASGSYVSITGTGETVVFSPGNDNEISGIIPIGFSFQFDGAAPTDVIMSTNV